MWAIIVEILKKLVPALIPEVVSYLKKTISDYKKDKIEKEVKEISKKNESKARSFSNYLDS